MYKNKHVCKSQHCGFSCMAWVVMNLFARAAYGVITSFVFFLLGYMFRSLLKYLNSVVCTVYMKNVTATTPRLAFLNSFETVSALVFDASLQKGCFLEPPNLETQLTLSPEKEMKNNKRKSLMRISLHMACCGLARGVVWPCLTGCCLGVNLIAASPLDRIVQ